MSSDKNTPLDIKQILEKSIDPKRGEKVIFVHDARSEDGVELSDGYLEMAERWKMNLIELGREIGFFVREYVVEPKIRLLDMAMNVSYEKTGGEPPLDLLNEIEKYDIVVSMSHYNGFTAKLRKIAKKTGLRGVNMPGVIPEMENTFFRADMDEMEKLGRRIKTKIENSLYAKVKFSTGHELTLDFRHRVPVLSTGKNTERGECGKLGQRRGVHHALRGS